MRLSSKVALSWLLVAGSALANHDEEVARSKPLGALAARSDEGSLRATSNHAPLTRIRPSGNSKPISAARAQGYGNEALRDLYVDAEYALNVKVGDEEVLLILDSGSSDTWIARKQFQCVSVRQKPRKQASCEFGPLFNGTFPTGHIKDENFNITYGDGEFVSGLEGYAELTVGGITVKKQQIALVNKAFWEGDSYTSGLMGFAYSALTSAFRGDDPTVDKGNVTGNATGDQVLYSPIIQTMIADKLLDTPLFSLALQRTDKHSLNTPGGYVAFGGLPPVSFDHTFASTPIEIHEFYQYPPINKKIRGFYTITPDAYVYENKGGKVASHDTSVKAIVDSGTTLLYVPPPVLDGYLASFNPPPVKTRGAYFYPCSAKAPFFGIKIAGTVFNVSSADIIVPDSGYKNQTSGVQYCLIGMLGAGKGPSDIPIFGDVFLKNVVAVFDQGNSMMSFAQHNY